METEEILENFEAEMDDPTLQHTLAKIDDPTSICVVCNRIFPLPNPTTDLKAMHLNVEELRHAEKCFAINFGLSPAEIAKVSFFRKPEIYPFCVRCTSTTRNLLKLQKQLDRSTIQMAAIMVNTHSYTLDESPFFDMKNLIFEKWYERTEEYCSEQQRLLDASPETKDESFIPLKSSPEKKSEISREVAILKKKGKGDVMPISIDEEEVEEVTCSVCNKIYRSKQHLTFHMKSHTGATRPYSCLYCEKSFFGASTLKKHLKTKHAQVPPEEMSMEVECPPSPPPRPKPPPPPPHCEIETQLAKVTMENGEEAHLIIGRRVETPPPTLADETQPGNQMEQADGVYFEERDISDAFSRSSGVVCDHCGKIFVSKVTLTKHIRTVHLKTIKVECPICKITTRDHYNLSKHIVSSHDPKLTKLSYNCPLCGDGFEVRRWLQRHYKKIHQLDIIRDPLPQPIVRALAKDDPMKMTIGLGDAASAGTAHPPTLELRGCPQTETVSIANPGKEVVGSSSVSTGRVEGFKPIKVGDHAVPPTPLVPNIPTVSLKKKRKRRRGLFTSSTTRAKLLRQRQRLAAEKLSHVKSEPGTSMVEEDPSLTTPGSKGVKLEPEMTIESLESDEVSVQAAQRCDPALMELNFNVRLEIEKVLIEIGDEDDLDEVNGVLQYAESGADDPINALEIECAESSMPPTLLPYGVKIYGPKSKLAEIRARKLKLHEPEDCLPISEESKSPELTTTTATVANPEGAEIKPGRFWNHSVPKSKKSVHTPGELRTYVGPKSKMTTMLPPLFKFGGKVDTAVSSNGGKPVGQPAHWKSFKPWITKEDEKLRAGLKRPNWDSVRKDDVLPTPLASISDDGRAVIMKTSPTRYNLPPIQPAPPVGLGGTQQRSPSSSILPKLQPSPANRVGRWEDATGILRSTPISTSSYFLSPKKALARFPLPNKQLAQIAKSFRKDSAKLGGTPFVHPVKAKVSGMARQLMKSGVTNRKIIPFGRTSTSSQASTIGPIIMNTRSLAGLPSASNMVSLDHSNGNGIHNVGVSTPAAGAPSRHNPIAAFHESPQGKTAQVEALMRNSHIAVSLVNPPPPPEESSAPPVNEPQVQVPESSSQFAMPRLPSGITLVQVEDVLKGDTPMEPPAALSPSPKRRFIQSLNRVARKQATTLNEVIPRVDTNQNEFLQSLNLAPIRIRSMASLTEPMVEEEEEEPEPYQAEQVAGDVPMELGSGNEYGLGNSQPPVPFPQIRLKTAQYRPFPQKETIRIMRYSEHIRVRQEQEAQRQHHHLKQYAPVFRQMTLLPVSTSNVKYVPLQPVFGIHDSDPTFQGNGQ